LNGEKTQLRKKRTRRRKKRRRRRRRRRKRYDTSKMLDIIPLMLKVIILGCLKSSCRF